MGVPEKATGSNALLKGSKGTNDAPWYVFYIPYILLYLSLLILLYIDYKLIETDKMEFIIFTNGIAVFVAILSFTNMLSRDPAINNMEFRRALIATLIVVFFTVLAIEATKVDTGQSQADNKSSSKIYDNLVGILIGAVTTIVGVYTGSRLTEEREKACKEKKRDRKGEEKEAGGDEQEG